MQWLQSAFSSSSSSANNNNNNNKRTFKDINYLFRKSKQSRRLTRQRKLRHLSDIDVGNIKSFNGNRFGENNEASSVSDVDWASARSSPAPQPQPLPLPELALFFKDSASTASNSGRFPLPSPKEIPTRPQSEEREDTGEDYRSNRNSPYHTTHKNSENGDTLSTKSTVDRGKKSFQDRNGFGSARSNFRSNASAPGSGVSSPALSPRRMSTGEAFPSPYMTTQGFVWSAPEMAAMDMFMDPFSQATSDKALTNSERSPRHGRGLYPKSSSSASPFHPTMLSPENASERYESNGHASVHPLPLPPVGPPAGHLSSSPSMLVHQSISTLEVSTVASQWQKGKLLGRGTFGSVYAATNRETGALCAMKEVDLIPDDPKSAECMKQLEQEIKVLSQLKHPNIVQYYGSEIVGDHFYIYLEYVHPGSINKYVRERCGAITEAVVRNFTRHILYGLAYLHSTKTVHRDIKGANLLVNACGVVKLADFGMAKHLSGQVAELSMKGSPYWMAPEIINAASQDSNSDFAFAVDIWSLGCTIIEIVNGKPPWSEFEGAAAMFKVWKESPPIPETLSPCGKDFLQCCFRRNPAERPSASMLLEHPFIKNSVSPDIQAFTQSFSAMRLGDPTHSPREWASYRADTMPVSSRTHTSRGKLSLNGETRQQSHNYRTSENAVTCLLSPRSTLEARSSLSPPHFDQALNSSKPPSNGVDGTPTGRTGNNLGGYQVTDRKRAP
ncbi:mitogen-activated protein kinase kinase kinase [Ranunculus cassubicifolius]